jgi:hypothetical protein
MGDFVTKGGQTTAFLRHYLPVEIALGRVCASRPSDAAKIKGMIMFLSNVFNNSFNSRVVTKS